MSCDWDVYCKDCGEGLGLNDWNHRDTDVLDLCVNASKLASIADLLDGMHCDIEVRDGLGGDSICLKWFQKHRGHNIVPRDEYGKFWDQCGKQVKCPHCISYFRCQFQRGHAGECGVKIR